MICCICLEEITNEDKIQCETTCKQYFHNSCIDKWLDIKSSCPFCRCSWTKINNNKNSNDTYINIYSFALYPIQYEPSGTANVSSI